MQSARPYSSGSKVTRVSRDNSIARDLEHLAACEINRDGVASETSSAAASRGITEQSVCCVLSREGSLM